MRVNFRTGDQWYFFSGQSENCLNIRVYSNGATDSDFETNPAVADEDIDEIHICDIEAFISALEQAKKIRDTEPRSW